MNRCFLVGWMLSTFIMYASEEAVLNAAKTGDLALLQANLHAAANAQEPDGASPLHVAINNKHAEVALYLIEHVPSLMHKQTEDGVTPLHAAARKNYVSALRLLLRYGLDVDVKDGQGRTPLDLACGEGHWQSVILLINEGALCDELRYDELLNLCGFLERHRVIRYIIEFWCPGAHRAFLKLDRVSMWAEIAGERWIYITEVSSRVNACKRCCFGIANQSLKEAIALLDLDNEIALLDPDRELPKDFIKKLVISFVAAQEDLNAALRFAEQDDQEETAQFLRSIGASDGEQGDSEIS